MQITTTLTTAAVLVASTAAQSTTTGTAAAASTSGLSSMVSDLPQCALGCLNTAAKDINCNAADLTCLCSHSNDFISSIGPCILFNSGCTSDERDEISSMASSICKDVVNNPNPTELASASNYLTSALATASGGSTSTGSASGNAAVRTNLPAAGMGAMGAAAAFAAFAL